MPQVPAQAATPSTQIRISVIGHAGCGKSTTAALVERGLKRRGLSVARLKLADPLYRLQGMVYGVAGREIDGDVQDQILMESLATHLRRIASASIVDDFMLRLSKLDVDAVVNDDLRDIDVDYPRLCGAGFRLIRVTASEKVQAQRLRARNDLTVVPHSETTKPLQAITPTAEFNNNGSLAQLTEAIENTLGALL